MSYLSDAVLKSAKDHARREYPRESCGVVLNDEYVSCKNVAEDPENDFQIATKEYVKLSEKGEIKAILHSHPDGPLHPSQADMQGQIDTNVPWGIIPLSKDQDEWRIGDPIMWGDPLPRPPLLGRGFVHGVTDCYSLLRDTFAAGKDELSRQEITNEWPYEPVDLPEFPRDDAWWNEGKDLYMDGLEIAGFRKIDISEVKPGDCFLGKIRSEKINHAGILVTRDLIMHQLPGRMSRREPAGIWGRSAEMWIRFEGLPDA